MVKLPAGRHLDRLRERGNLPDGGDLAGTLRPGHLLAFRLDVSRRQRNLALTALLIALLATLVVQQTRGDPGLPRLRTPTPTVEQAPGDAAAARSSPAAPPVGARRLDSATRLYAVATTELDGLPPDPAPGTRLELWVAWDRPVTSKPKLQKLFPSITLREVVPGATPQGPDAAMLEVKVNQIVDLLYADRYGSLSVTVLPPRP